MIKNDASLLEHAVITWQENDQPLSTTHDDIYFSKENGIAESRYVFIEGNHLPERWKNATQAKAFTVFETGFGTGLNFLLTWQQWLQSTHTHNNTPHLHYISVEKYPLSYADLNKSLAHWHALTELSKKLLAHYPDTRRKGVYHIDFFDNDSRVSLTLLFYDIQEALQAFEQRTPYLNQAQQHSEACFASHPPSVDAWYLDGFAPAKNADMWPNELFHSMRTMSHIGTTVATFTAAGLVRRQLIAAGFDCVKQAGYGRKREMLVAEKKEDSLITSDTYSNTMFPVKDSWMYGQAKANTHVSSVMVIGAGLAGSHIAHALAQAGLQVTVIDKAGIASGASGNAQGAVYTRLSHAQDALSDFNLHAQLYADQFYTTGNYYDHCGQQCGVFHLANTARSHNNYRQAIEQLGRQHVQWVEQKNTEKITGLPLHCDGIYLPNSGWLDPRKLCLRLLDHANIHVIQHTLITDIEQQSNKHWHALDAKRHVIASAMACVICNAEDAKHFSQTQPLPMKKIRGQVSHVSSNQVLKALKSVICGEGYIAPTTFDKFSAGKESIHAIGATFNLHDTSLALTDSDHEKNIAALTSISSVLSEQDIKLVKNATGRVAFRSTTPDYFPIVGPLPNWKNLENEFSWLSKKANAQKNCTGHYYDNLYCHLGFGSRGLAYAPITARMLAHLITGKCLPISKRLYKHMHPARFTIRNVIRGSSKP